MSVAEEVKSRLDIVEIISTYVPLKKAGRTFKGLCPFHTEKTPSFVVFPDNQSWHCFGSCGIGGDVFSFVMQKEKLDFPETLQLLAQRAGVALTPRGEEASPEEARRPQRAGWSGAGRLQARRPTSVQFVNFDQRDAGGVVLAGGGVEDLIHQVRVDAEFLRRHQGFADRQQPTGRDVVVQCLHRVPGTRTAHMHQGLAHGLQERADGVDPPGPVS